MKAECNCFVNQRDVKVTHRTLLQDVTYEIRMDKPAESVTVTICPAPANSGIHFLRVGGSGRGDVVGADLRNARINDGDIDLVNGDGVSVRKVGNLLAALRIAGIVNAIIQVNADTVDIRYSDVAGLLAELGKNGLENRVAPCEKAPLRKCAAVEEGGCCAVALPSDRLVVELFIADGACDDDWCHAEFDAREFSGPGAAPDENGGFGIRTKGDPLPPERVHGQMLLALGLLALLGDYPGIQFRGINFRPDVGLRLLNLLMNDESDGI